MNEYLRRTWAVVNLDNLEFNIAKIKESLPIKTKIMAVVKADGYGHGSLAITQTLIEYGVDFFAVSNLDEAIFLRKISSDIKILILGFTPAIMAKTLSDFNIIQTVFWADYAKELNKECETANVTINVHLKIDTGMGRIGFVSSNLDSALTQINELSTLKRLNIEGIFTHLSSADSLDADSVEYTKNQTTSFDRLTLMLEETGIKFKAKHLQNSAGIAYLTESCYDYARAGIIIYGVPPSNEPFPLELKPLMEIKSVITMVKEIEIGDCVSYGRTFTAKQNMKIATVPIGYADGYPRLLSNKGYMLVNGQRADIIGNICMDQLMLDVSNIENVKPQDIVTVVGHDGDLTISFIELAELVNSISYELMCLISRRVPRIYEKNGKIVRIVHYEEMECL